MHALLIVDMQNDFVEGGVLAVRSGNILVPMINSLMGKYDLVVASRDWHDPVGDNGGHFSFSPDYRSTWPKHCVAGTHGAEYVPGLDLSKIDVHIKKGQGVPGYSAFDGTVGNSAIHPEQVFQYVTTLDVVGIATEFCVRESAYDAVQYVPNVRVLSQYCGSVDRVKGDAAFLDMIQHGITVPDYTYPQRHK